MSENRIEDEQKRIRDEQDRVREESRENRHEIAGVRQSLALLTEQVEIVRTQQDSIRSDLKALMANVMENQVRFERVESKLHTTEGRSKSGAQTAIELDARVDRLESIVDRFSGQLKGYAVVVTVIATIIPLALNWMRYAGN